MTVSCPDLQHKNVETFFSHFQKVIERNDVEEAAKVAHRIKKIFGTQPVNSQDSHLFTIALFHQRIINILNKADNLAASKMRGELSNYYFTQSINYLQAKHYPVTWHSEREVREKVGDPRVANGFYYHATSLTGLIGILLLGKILVRHNRFYRGAFVSQRDPEWDYGSYVLVFNKCIERASPLSTHTLDNEHLKPYIGFARPIPVNKDTLSHIIVRNAPVSMVKLISTILTGRNILVLSDYESSQLMAKSPSFNTPIEWRGEYGARDYCSRSPDDKPASTWRNSPFLPSKL